MSHCFACDSLLSSPTLDQKTGRYYCGNCFFWTELAMLEIAGLDLELYNKSLETQGTGSVLEDLGLSQAISQLSSLQEEFSLWE